MQNAKAELIDHIENRKVIYAQISTPHGLFEGSLEDVLPHLDFEYDDWFGSQHIDGTIWYDDGSWSNRAEYDGSEWWAHISRPPIPVKK